MSLLVYATATNLARVGVSAETTAAMDAGALAEVLDDRSRYADGYLQSSGKIVLPITAWGADLTLAVCQLAAWDIMTSVVGINPETPSGAIWQTRRDEAQRWLEGVAAGRITPQGIVDATPTEDPKDGVAVYTDPPRGW